MDGSRSRRRRSKRQSAQLGLFERGTWGGARPGAGRPRTGRTSVPHRRRERFKKKPVHVTLRARDGVGSLRRGRARRAIVRILALACAAPGFRITDWSIQHEHLHLVCEGRTERELSRNLQGLSSRLAKRLNQLFRRNGPLWRERYHAHVLTTPREVRHALVYVLHNGKHHPITPRGSIPPHAIDACSSALYFDGWREPVPRPPPDDPPPVAKPATWLRAAGWRRHGLLSTHDTPAQPPAAARRP